MISEGDLKDIEEDNLNNTDFKNMNNKTKLTFLNTNARSLCPKMESLVDGMEELQAAFAIVTETWLVDGGSTCKRSGRLGTRVRAWPHL